MFGSRRRNPDAFDVQLEQWLDGVRRTAVPEVISGACDRCPAAAVARVRLPSGSVLMLCGHHGRRHAPALRVQGALLTGGLTFAAPADLPVQAGAE